MDMPFEPEEIDDLDESLFIYAALKRL